MPFSLGRQSAFEVIEELDNNVEDEGTKDEEADEDVTGNEKVKLFWPRSFAKAGEGERKSSQYST